MNISNLSPLPSEKKQFHLSHYKSIPKESGCYALTTFDGNILYIGYSARLHERFQHHIANPEKTNPTLEGKAVWFYFLLYPESALAKLERTWLRQFDEKYGGRPILNKIDSPVG